MQLGDWRLVSVGERLVQRPNPREGCDCGAPAAVGHVELAVAVALLYRIEGNIEGASCAWSQRSSAGVGGDGVIGWSACDGKSGQVYGRRAKVRDGYGLGRGSLAHGFGAEGESGG